MEKERDESLNVQKRETKFPIKTNGKPKRTRNKILDNNTGCVRNSLPDAKTG